MSRKQIKIKIVKISKQVKKAPYSWWVHSTLAFFLIAALVVSVFTFPSPKIVKAVIAEVQTNSGESSETGLGSNDDTSVASTWGGATTAGNLLVATLGFYGNPGTITAPAGGWTLVNSISNGTQYTYMYYIENAASQSGTKTWTWGTGNRLATVILAEFSGIATSSALDQNATNTGTSATPTTNSITTTQASELLVAALGCQSDPPADLTLSAPTNSFSIYNQEEISFATRTERGGLLDRIVSSTGTYSTAATSAASCTWATLIASFKGVTGVTIGGTVYTDEGTTNIGANKTVAVSINGAAAAGTDDTDASGVYSITGLTVAANDVITLYIDGETEKGVTVTKGTGLDMSSIHIFKNDLITRCDNSCSLTNSNLDTADNNADPDISDIYSVSGGALTVAAGKSLFIPSSHTFVPGGNVNVGGNFTNNGTYTKGTETVTLTGTGTQTLKTNSSSLYDLTINGSGSTYTLQDALAVTDILTISAGTLNAGSFTTTLSGSGTPFVVNGTFTASTSTVNYTGDGATNIAGTMYYNLHVGNALTQTAARTYSLAASATVSNAVTVGPSSGSYTHLFSLGSSTLTLSGTGAVFSIQSNGNISSGTSTIIIADTSSSSKTFAGAGKTYYNFLIQGSGTGAVIITGNNTFNNFTINALRTVTFPSSGTQSFNGSFSCSGSPNNLITINASTGGVAATLYNTSEIISCDYLSLQDSAATGGASWNAGCHSSNVSGNSGWTFPGCGGGGGGGGDDIIYHNECRTDRCVLISGEGADQCQNDEQCIATHTECDENDQCVEVQGAGTNVCTTDTDCVIPPTHTECNAQDQCVVVDGEGTDQCLDNFDCIVSTHTECNTQDQCIIVDGVGIDQCLDDSDCILPTHNECNSQLQCVPFPGIGLDLCQNNNDCITIPPTEPPPPDEPPAPPPPFVKEIQKDAVLISTQLKEVIEKPLGSAVTKITSTVGVLIPLAVTAANLVFVPSLIDIVLSIMRLWGALLSVLGIRGRIKHWGTTYDAVTKQPLDPAQVVITDMEGKEVALAITDIDGRYGFLVPPGLYRLAAKKTNYAFPSQKVTGKIEDEMYGNLYFGEPIEIKKTGEVIVKNIPMDPVKFDWNEFAKKNKTFMKFYSHWDSFLRKISDLFFVIGFFVAIGSYVFAPYPYNTIILVVYLVLLLLRVFGLKPKSFGYIIEKSTGAPLSFAIVHVMMPSTTVQVAQRVADAYGRYYCLVPKGKYYIKIDKKNPDGTYTTIHTSQVIDASKNGIIKKKIHV